MKYLRTLERQDPRDTAPVIEEYSGVELVRATGRTDRWLGLAIALSIVVIGFGVGGRIWTPPLAGASSGGSSTPPLVGQVVGPTFARVDAIADPSPAGPYPSDGDGASVLELSSATRAGSISVSLQRSVTSGRSRGAAGILMHGHATAEIASVTVDIRTLSGSLLASAVVSNAVDDERPGSDGGPRVGVDGLRRLLVVPGPVPTDGWQIEITWRDGSNGTSGSLTQRVPTTGL